MAERKIFNFESNILDQETFDEYGYLPEKYGKTSSKFVIATCRYCGEKMPIRKGFFNKAGSACHKVCRIEEQKKMSPFSDSNVIKKAQDRLDEKYGKDRKKIGEKISKTKNTQESKDKTKNTCLEKYGVENVFQSEEIKNKIKKTNLEKYGVESPLQNKDILKKAQDTNIERYGASSPLMNEETKSKMKETNKNKYGVDNPQKNKDVRKKTLDTMNKKYDVSYPLQNKEIFEKYLKTLNDNYREDSALSAPLQSKEILDNMLLNNKTKYGFTSPSQHQEIKDKISKTYKETIKKDEKGFFNLINTLREEPFWEDLAQMTLSEISQKYDVNYNSLTNQLNKEEFKEKYSEIYTFPKTQIQKSIADHIVANSEYDVEFNTRKIIPPLELDIYVPERNFAIEFNGSYWHSEACLDRKEAYRKHRNKTDLCRYRGIRLLHIFEHNWNGNEDRWKSYISNILGLNTKRIMGRNCVVTNDPAPDLIKNNHLQGLGGAPMQYFSLLYDNKIVGTMTANKHHRQNADKKDIVLGRLVFEDGVNVLGGASKLFKYFKQWAKNMGYSRIISWSDNTYSYGDVYEKMGFSLEKEYDPDYFYWDMRNRCYRSKQSQRKSATGCPPDITERDWCMGMGLYRIWDCGKKKWIYRTARENPTSCG